MVGFSRRGPGPPEAWGEAMIASAEPFSRCPTELPHQDPADLQTMTRLCSRTRSEVRGQGRGGHSMFTSPLPVPPVETCRLLLASVCRKTPRNQPEPGELLTRTVGCWLLSVYCRTVKTDETFFGGFCFSCHLEHRHRCHGGCV